MPYDKPGLRFPERYPRRARFIVPSFACPCPVRRSENTTPITPFHRRPKPPRRGLIGGNIQIPYLKDFLDVFCDRGRTGTIADAANCPLARTVEPCFENPCVGGSIPPRATKNIPHETPTITGWRCCLWAAQSSCPVYFWYSKQTATLGEVSTESSNRPSHCCSPNKRCIVSRRISLPWNVRDQMQIRKIARVKRATLVFERAPLKNILVHAELCR